MPKSVEDYLDFLLKEKGKNVVIRGIQAKAIITDVNEKISYYDDKIIRTDMEIHTGERIDYQADQWIVISEIDKNKNSYKARIRKMNYTIKIVVDEVLCEFISIIEGISFGIDEGKFMNFEAGKIQVTIPADSVSNKIDVDMRFIKMDKAWKVVGVDKSRLGIVILHCEKDLFGSYDDRINEIANTNLIAIWEIQINEENRQVALNKEFTFTATVMKNSTEYQGAVLVWASSDENIAVVNDGVITGVAIGSVEISVYIQDKPTVKTNIQIEVVESILDVITYKMWSSYTDGSGKSYTDFSVRYGSSKWFGVEKYVNGVLADVNDTYSFSLNPNGTPSSNYIYTVVNDNKVKLEGEGYGYSVILSATSNESGEILTQSIQLKSLF